MGQDAAANFGYGFHLSQEICDRIEQEIGRNVFPYELEDALWRELKSYHDNKHGKCIDPSGYLLLEDCPDTLQGRLEFKDWWMENTPEGNAAAELEMEWSWLDLFFANGGEPDYPQIIIMDGKTSSYAWCESPVEVSLSELYIDEKVFKMRLARFFELIGLEVDFEIECKWYLAATYT